MSRERERISIERAHVTTCGEVGRLVEGIKMTAYIVLWLLLLREDLRRPIFHGPFCKAAGHFQTSGST